jgi:hypothetical protein
LTAPIACSAWPHSLPEKAIEKSGRCKQTLFKTFLRDTPVVLALRRLRLKVCEFKDSLGYKVRPGLSKHQYKF